MGISLHSPIQERFASLQRPAIDEWATCFQGGIDADDMEWLPAAIGEGDP